MELQTIISTIQPGQKEAVRACQTRLDHIAKPLASLGQLETMLCRIAGAQGTADIQTEKNVS